MNCGTILPDHARFCRNCGAELQKQGNFKETQKEAVDPSHKRKVVEQKSDSNHGGRPPGKKAWLARIITIIAVVFVCIGLFQNLSGNAERREDSDRINSEFINISEPFTDQPVTDAISAIDSLKVFADILGTELPQAVLVPQNENEINNRIFYRSQQMYAGIPVLGRSLVVVANADAATAGVVGNYILIGDVDLDPKITENDAQSFARSFLVTELGCDEEDVQTESGGLIIYSLGVDPVLSYQIAASSFGKTHYSLTIIVHASDGSILKVGSNIFAYAGQDGAEYGELPFTEVGGVKYMSDSRRNIDYYSYRYFDRSNPFPPDILSFDQNNKSAIDAMGNISEVYDFFNQVLGRTQFDNRGSKLNVYVNVVDDVMGHNAYYDPSSRSIFCTVPSRFAAGPFAAISWPPKEWSRALDFMGHEFAHGVTNTTSGLNGSNQAGALNESLSDIFGEIIERWVTGKCDWSFGGKRNMQTPAFRRDYDPKAKVHANAAIADYVGYQIGSHFIGDSNMPKDRVEELAKLWYGVDLLIPSDCTFEEFAVVTIQMAEWMHSSGEIFVEDVQVIKNAFTDAGIATEIRSPEGMNDFNTALHRLQTTRDTLQNKIQSARQLYENTLRGRVSDPNKLDNLLGITQGAMAVYDSIIDLPAMQVTTKAVQAQIEYLERKTSEVEEAIRKLDEAMAAVNESTKAPEWGANIYVYDQEAYGGRWGVIDEKGNWIIEPKYKELGHFAENGLIAAIDPESNLHGYLDIKGNWIIPPKFISGDYMPRDFSKNGLAAVQDQTSRLWGYIDERGNWTISPQFGDINIEYGIGAYDFSENGLALVQNPSNGLWGFIDKKGDWLIAPCFSSAGDFSSIGLAIAWDPASKACGYIDKEGNWIIPPNPAWWTCGSFAENGLACVQDRKSYHYGFIDASGNWVIEPKFISSTSFGEYGLAPIVDYEEAYEFGKQGHWGYVNEKGNWVIAPKFLGAGGFAKNGLAIAVDEESKRVGFIDTNGNWVIEPKFNLGNSFSENGLALACKDGFWGYIDESGDWAIEPQYTTPSHFSVQGDFYRLPSRR
jgi:Zn-dependent metalloprotease